MKLASILARTSLLALATSLSLSTAAAEDLPYKMVLKSDLKMDIPDSKTVIAADTELGYTWTHSAGKQVLSFDFMSIQATSNGKVATGAYMSRAKFTDSSDSEKPKTIALEDASPELKTLLTDSFGVPLFTRHFDAQGNQVSTETSARAGAKDLVENGIIVNGLLFHPIPPLDKESWQSDTEVSMGNGGYAKGKLAYEKIPGKRGTTKYKVSGILANAHHQQEGNPVGVKNARYVVTGEQTYDEAAKAWSSGKFGMAISFEMVSKDKPFGTAKGTMEATMQRRAK